MQKGNPAYKRIVANSPIQTQQRYTQLLLNSISSLCYNSFPFFLYSFDYKPNIPFQRDTISKLNFSNYMILVNAIWLWRLINREQKAGM